MPQKPWIAPTGFDEQVLDGQPIAKNQAPDGTHWFGTNDLFLDIYSHTIWGARTALQYLLQPVTGAFGRAFRE